MKSIRLTFFWSSFCWTTALACSAQGASNTSQLTTLFQAHHFSRADPQRDERILKCIEDGDTVDLTAIDPRDQTVDSQFVSWLCANPEAKTMVHHAGIHVLNATMVGELDLSSINVSFPLYFESCEILDGIDLRFSHLPTLRILKCTVGGITAHGLRVDNDVNLRGSTFLSLVDFEAASISGDLACTGTSFAKRGTVSALYCQGLQVGGDFLLRTNFRITGTLDLRHARIRGDLDCSNGVIRRCHYDQVENDCPDCEQAIEHALNKNDPKGAIYAPGLEVGDNAYFRDCTIIGWCVFTDAVIRSDFEWTGIALPCPAFTKLNLQSARIDRLEIGSEGWPQKDNVTLNGLKFQRLTLEEGKPPTHFLELIRRQPIFRPQPYEQLASALERQGESDAATRVLIAREWDSPVESVSSLAWKILGSFIGYGYRPIWATGIAVLVILFGWWVFSQADRQRLMRPTDAGATSGERAETFNAFMYSLDVFVPAIDFLVADAWLPDASKGEPCCGRIRAGQLVWIYMWCHMVFGIVLSALFIAGISGVLKR